MTVEWLAEQLESHGITLSDHQKDQFRTYYDMLVTWNDKINLTSITEEHEVYLKHFYDSITPSFYHDFTEPLSLSLIHI